MTTTESTRPDSTVTVPEGRPSRLGAWYVIAGFALVLLLVLGWQLVKDPTMTAPTRDPAWYTWRSNLILQSDPGSIAKEWGPDAVFSGGYRVTAPLAGALLQRIAGIDLYSFSAFMMVGIPVLAGLALGAAGYRSRKDPLIVLIAMLATVAMFLTTPYVGYLDDLTMLFLLCVMLAFVAPARTSWGARTALFLLSVAAAFTHPTTCALFGLSLMVVFFWHLITSKWKLGAALRSDGPMLMSVGFGMIFGLSAWLVGIWGQTAKLSDAAAPPPYTKLFFQNRLWDWVTSMQPLITAPLIVLGVLGVIFWSRRERQPAYQNEIVAIWWLFPLIGALTFLLSPKPVPYYRFMNATAAPVALVGLGSFFAVRWFLGRTGAAKIAGVLAAVALIGALAWVLSDGVQHRWTAANNQFVDQNDRIALAAVHEVAAAAGERPIILVVNYNNVDDPQTHTNVAYGWAKTYTNVFRSALPGASAQYQATYLGTLDNFMKGRPSTGPSSGYRTISDHYMTDLQARMKEFPEPPLVFVIGGNYGGKSDVGVVASNGRQIVPGSCTPSSDGLLAPDQSSCTWVVTGSTGSSPLWAPPNGVLAGAQSAAQAEASALANHPGYLADPLHLLRVLIGLFLLAVLPGLLAAPFFEIRDTPSRIALIPAMSIVITLLSGIALLTVWRGSLTPTKSWAVVALAVGVGAVLRLAVKPITGTLKSFGGFFDEMFSVFSNHDFAMLMGVQFMVMAADGVIRGSIAKSIVFGGQKGFDVTTVPSAGYLLKVVLALYVPYTIISPFIGVFIDRFERRRVLAFSGMLCAALVVAVAAGAMLPLKGGTSQGKIGITAALILGMLVSQACVRVILAVKSAAMPGVLSGKDLLQGNGLSQAGGALFQVLGIGFGLGFGAVFPAWFVVALGAGLLVVSALVARGIQRMEFSAHTTSFGQEAKRVIKDMVAGLKEVAGRPAAALGLTSFQMLRYQFWGFSLFVFALYARSLVASGEPDTMALGLVGGGGFLGGAIGMVLAQKYKDKIPPVRILLGAMVLLGVSTILFGSLVSLPGFALQLFVGFFAFFVGKISADTIMQQSMPDDFRGRAFALFDIAYNLGFIIPALILNFVWTDGNARAILIASGVVYLILTALVARWASRIKDQFAPQDDLVEVG